MSKTDTIPVETNLSNKKIMIVKKTVYSKTARKSFQRCLRSGHVVSFKTLKRPGINFTVSTPILFLYVLHTFDNVYKIY